jgi:hypothetical protein
MAKMKEGWLTRKKKKDEKKEKKKKKKKKGKRKVQKIKTQDINRPGHQKERTKRNL